MIWITSPPLKDAATGVIKHWRLLYLKGNNSRKYYIQTSMHVIFFVMEKHECIATSSEWYERECACAYSLTSRILTQYFKTVCWYLARIWASWSGIKDTNIQLLIGILRVPSFNVLYPLQVKWNKNGRDIYLFQDLLLKLHVRDVKLEPNLVL